MSDLYSTRHKLNEAKYFMSQIQSIYSQYLEEGTGELFYTLHYNLSAFYSAARSVTLYMQKEYSYKQGFSEWYELKRAEMKNDPELKFLVWARNLYLKEKYPSTGISEVLCVAEYELCEGVYVLTHSADIFSDTLDVKLGGIYFSDMCDVLDVLDLCNHQIEKLERIVGECEEMFNR